MIAQEYPDKHRNILKLIGIVWRCGAKNLQRVKSFLAQPSVKGSPGLAADQSKTLQLFFNSSAASRHLQNLFPHPTGKRLHMLKLRVALRHVDPSFFQRLRVANFVCSTEGLVARYSASFASSGRSIGRPSTLRA
ncbi:hypothetical protein KNO81_10845 [Paraburkholderia sediminicola]|nr:hypothetical protein [Paraburkholderia sediminicola]